MHPHPRTAPPIPDPGPADEPWPVAGVCRGRSLPLAIALLGLAGAALGGCVSEPIARELRFWGDHGVAAVTGDDPARD